MKVNRFEILEHQGTNTLMRIEEEDIEMDDALVIIDNTKKAQDEFGHCFGSDTILVTEEHIKALKSGKQLAFNVAEYTQFLRMSKHE